MSSKAEQRKAELRDRLVDVTGRRIASDGLSSVKARDVAAEAGCALGAIYNVFDDLNALILAVNGRTFRKIGEAVAASLSDSAGRMPVERLILMSNAYLGFAAENTHLWRALFDIDMSNDGAVPDWYRDELQTLFGHIAGPVAELFPDLGPKELDLMVRALFSAVHGIVLLGLQNRISGVSRHNIEAMIAQVLCRIGN
ncbi:TetR/AcrR family transcriptional regulator [Defluviimonas sp. SAOS-178_SWC]|uniref:TetR/AcrR family transcriptional regulator n=1 Tax=Defluviimonas sp. SAOS-178_SWC TaxID=3121287 RepID=UPI003222170C